MSDLRGGKTADFDADAIYRLIGMYVVSFQHLENLLFQMSWFFGDPPYSEVGRLRLVKKGFSALIAEADKRASAFLLADGRDNSDFARSFKDHLGECRRIERERNRIVHSAYIHLEGGGELQGILRSDMRRAKDGASVELHQDLLSEQSLESELHRLAKIVFNVSFDLRQLTIWGPEPRSTS